VVPIPILYKSYINQTHTIESKKSRVLFVGRLSYEKNLSGLFNVINRINKSVKNADFIIIGDGPDRSYVKKSIASINRNKIEYHKVVKYEEMRAWYQQAQVVILPSLHEGFGRVLVESYLHKTPAVATICGGPEDIILDGETGFLTSIDEMDYFADRVIWLLDNPESAAEMGRKGYEYVKHKFSPNVLINQIVQQWLQLNDLKQTSL
jgi:glycosyltransferase involved in cell wall biosynthesis